MNGEQQEPETSDNKVDKYHTLTIETQNSLTQSQDVKEEESPTFTPGELDDNWKKILENKDTVDIQDDDFGTIYLNHWRKHPFDNQDYMTLTRMLHYEHPVVNFSDKKRVNLLIQVTGGAFDISLFDDKGFRLTAKTNADRRTVSIEDLPYADQYELRLESITRKQVHLLRIEMSDSPQERRVEGAIIRYSFSTVPNRRENSRIVFPIRSITVEPIQDVLFVELDVHSLLDVHSFIGCSIRARYDSTIVDLGVLDQETNSWYFEIPLEKNPKQLSITLDSETTLLDGTLDLFPDGQLLLDGIHDCTLVGRHGAFSIGISTVAHVYPPLSQNKLWNKLYNTDQDLVFAQFVDMYSQSSDVLFQNEYSETERYQWLRHVTKVVIKCMDNAGSYTKLDPLHVIQTSLFNFMTDLFQFVLTSETHHFDLYTVLLRKRFVTYLDAFADHLMVQVHAANKEHDYILLLSLLAIAAYTVYLVQEPIPISLAILKMANVLLQRISNDEIFMETELYQRIQVLVMLFTLAYPNRATVKHEAELVKYCHLLQRLTPVHVSPLCAFVEHMSKYRVAKPMCIQLMLHLLRSSPHDNELLRPLWCLFSAPTRKIEPLFELLVDRIPDHIAYQLIASQYIIQFRPDMKWNLLNAVSNAPFTIVHRVLSSITSGLMFPVVERVLDGKLTDLELVFRLYLTEYNNHQLEAITSFIMWVLISTTNPITLMEQAFRTSLELNPNTAMFKPCDHHHLHRAVLHVFQPGRLFEITNIRFGQVQEQLQSIVRETISIGPLKLVDTPYDTWLDTSPMFSSLESVLSLHYLLDRFIPIGSQPVVLDLIQLLIRVHASNIDHIRASNSLLLLAAILFGYDELAIAFEFVSVVRSGQLDALLDSLEEKLVKTLDSNQQDYTILEQVANVLDLASNVMETADQGIAEIIRSQCISAFKRLPTSTLIRDKLRALYQKQVLLYSTDIISHIPTRYFSVQLLSPPDTALICNQGHHIIEFSTLVGLENELRTIVPNIIILSASELLPPFQNVTSCYARISPAIRVSGDTYRTFDHLLQDRELLMPKCIAKTLRVNGLGMYASRLSPVLSVQDDIITECEANCEYFECLTTNNNIDMISDVFKEGVVGVPNAKMLLACYDALFEDQKRELFTQVKRAWVIEKMKADSEGKEPPKTPEMSNVYVPVYFCITI
jgi:hypothetical protein